MDRAELGRILAPYPEMLTAAEVAGVLRVHLRSVQRWARQGRVSSVRVGRSCRIPRTEALRWMLAASTQGTVWSDAAESAERRSVGETTS